MSSGVPNFTRRENAILELFMYSQYSCNEIFSCGCITFNLKLSKFLNKYLTNSPFQGSQLNVFDQKRKH